MKKYGKSRLNSAQKLVAVTSRHGSTDCTVPGATSLAQQVHSWSIVFFLLKIESWDNLEFQNFDSTLYNLVNLVRLSP